MAQDVLDVLSDYDSLEIIKALLVDNASAKMTWARINAYSTSTPKK